jgi:hypothetical protein
MMPPKNNLMAAQLTSNTEALRLFFTDDIYLVPNEMQVQEPAPVYNAPKSFTYHGKNVRKVLILVNDASHEVSSASATALLWKIAGAIKLTPEDCALVNLSTYPDTNFKDLQAFFKPQFLLSFGVLPAALGLPEQEMNVLGQQQGMNAIFSAGLLLVESDENIKKGLWKSLKQLTLS